MHSIIQNAQSNTTDDKFQEIEKKFYDVDKKYFTTEKEHSKKTNSKSFIKFEFSGNEYRLPREEKYEPILETPILDAFNDKTTLNGWKSEYKDEILNELKEYRPNWLKYNKSKKEEFKQRIEIESAKRTTIWANEFDVVKLTESNIM